MKGIEYDTSKTGFYAVLTDWQLKTMEAVWTFPNGVKSRMVHQKVNQNLKGETISRASVINFLEDMREMGVFSGVEESGKGGYHWVYSPKLDEAGFKRFIVEKMIDCLMGSFPEETKEAIKKMT